MDDVIHLPPVNGLTGRYMTKQGHYEAYRTWRKGAGYTLWMKSQWRIQKGKCYYCKVSLVGRRRNVEHVMPQSAWGETSRKNMVLSCPDCNKAKGSRIPSKELLHNVGRFNHNKRTRKRSKKI